MKTPPSRNTPLVTKQPRKPRRKAFHVATCGRERVSVYRRIAPNGSPCFMVANYADGRRRFDSYPGEAEAIEAAGKLARQLSEREVLAAAMTNEQASEYAAAVQRLAPFNVGLLSAADAVAGALKLVGDLPNLHAAAKSYHSRQKQTTAKRVAVVVGELLLVKAARGASKRYLEDLRSRLNRFASRFQKNTGDVTTAEVQAWLDTQKKLSPQTHVNFRRVIHLFYKFAVARGYALENPVDGVERIKVRNSGDVAVFTPAEIKRLLAAASTDFQPCLAIGAFAGLRSAEIERLEWSDIDLARRHITVGADKAKTASRRVVTMAENLCEWLQPYAERRGRVWPGSHEDFYQAQQDTATAAGLTWKANALRHSAASYMFALSNDAGRVAGNESNAMQRQMQRQMQIKKNDKASPLANARKLSLRQKELADRFEFVLGDQWVNDAGKWINRIKSETSKVERVISEVENAIKESRIGATPAQYAEDTWKRFAP